MIKLYHDDCFNIFPQLEDKSIDLVLCDMPYGTTACKWDTILDLERMWKELKGVVKDNTAIVLFAGQPFTSKLISSNLKTFKYCAVWEKSRPSSFMLAKKQLMRYHEDIVIFYTKQCTFNPIKTVGNKSHSSKQSYRKNNILALDSFINPINTSNEKYPSSIIKIKSTDSTTNLHPTQKPVALMEYLIKTYSNEGDVVLDFCMGSGTTGVACKNLNRSFIGIEKEEKYFQIAKNRIYNDEK